MKLCAAYLDSRNLPHLGELWISVHESEQHPAQATSAQGLHHVSDHMMVLLHRAPRCDRLAGVMALNLYKRCCTGMHAGDAPSLH